jgi:5-oxoprolinase (ATP-hydrolysing)
MVPRGTSATADAYLTPEIKKYITGFNKGFDGDLGNKPAQQNRGTRCEFMQSDGGLVDVSKFSGLRAILSGPAGGVVGYSLTSYDPETKIPVIGFDMGGTSTGNFSQVMWLMKDVSRYAGRYEHVFETTTAGVTIQSPQLDINTVAAGGGSRLFWKNGLFVVGPESAGAHPGPACYRFAQAIRGLIVGKEGLLQSLMRISFSVVYYLNFSPRYSVRLRIKDSIVRLLQNSFKN